MAQINFNPATNLGYSHPQPHMFPTNVADPNANQRKQYPNENMPQNSYDNLKPYNEMKTSQYQMPTPFHSSANGPSHLSPRQPQEGIYQNGMGGAHAPPPPLSAIPPPHGGEPLAKPSNYVDGHLVQAFDNVDLNAGSLGSQPYSHPGTKAIPNVSMTNGADFLGSNFLAPNAVTSQPVVNGYGHGHGQYNQPTSNYQGGFPPPGPGLNKLQTMPYQGFGPAAFPAPQPGPAAPQLAFQPPGPPLDAANSSYMQQQQPPMGAPPQAMPHLGPPMGSMAPQVNQFAGGMPGAASTAPSFYAPQGQPYAGMNQQQHQPGGPPMGQMGGYPYTQQPMGNAGLYPSPGSNQHPMGYSPQGPLGPGPAPVKKLDPDSLPNPVSLNAPFSAMNAAPMPGNQPLQIQVLDEDKKIKTGLYRCEDNKDALPPMVTTDFVADNNVNCSPRFIRSSLYCAPCTPDLIKSSAIPLALTITPFAKMHPSESPLPIIDFGEMGPVRCNRCKAYMCPFMMFNDGGRKFYCPFCKTHTEVPPEYFNHLDYNGKRIDLPQRPELFCGSFEMLATKEYCKNNEPPNPPALIFLFDVSYNAMHSGLVPHICSNIKSLLFSLKEGEDDLGNKLKIGIMTYDQMIHFYLAKDPEHPKIVFLPDLTEVFVPSDTEFLLTLDEMIHSIDSITDQILANFHDTKLTEVILGPAIQASLEALKQSSLTGKLIIFHTSLPNMEAPGKLENKDDPKLLGTEKEKAEIDGERLVTHVQEVLKRPLAFDAIMKVRTSTGLRPVEYFGNFFMENSTDVEIAVMDSENSITVELKHDDKLSEQENLYIQVAILYTTMSGQRRLRIHNLSMRSSNQYTDIFRMCDLDTLVNLLTKQAVRGVFTSTLKQVKEGLSRQCAQILACYRKQCATSSASGQLILPECMKLLPLYVGCLLKSDALLGGVSIKTDDRNWILFVVRNMSVLDSNRYVYPRLLPLHNLNESAETDETAIPEMLRCSASKLEKHGVYLLDNGLSLYLWMGSLVNQEFLQEVFGLTLISQIDVNKLNIIRESDPQATWVKRLLLEDASTVCAEMPSYVDFLCYIHKEIRSMLDA